MISGPGRLAVRQPIVRAALRVFMVALLFTSRVAMAQPAACNPAAGEIAVPGGQVHYLETGNGPRVVLLHGLFAQKEQWVPFMCMIAGQGFAVIAPDLPGFGKSTGFSTEVYRLESQVELLKSLVAGLNAGSFHLAGNSMGGAIAGLYQRRFGEDVRSLAFIGGPMGVVDWGPRLRAALEQGVNPFIPVTTQQFELELSLLFDQPPVVPAATAEQLVQGYRSSYDHYLTVWNIVTQYPRALIDGESRQSGRRVLAIWGEEDGVFDVSGIEKLAGVYGGLRVERLARTGHLPMIEQPQETAARYLEFLR